MGFNSAFKGLILLCKSSVVTTGVVSTPMLLVSSAS
jgi:hypothetical protein